MMGRCPSSIHPRCQSILGCTAANQEYPRMALCSPRSDRKKRIVVRLLPVCTSRSEKYFSSPLLFSVLSTLYSFLGSGSCLIGSCSHLAYCKFMKFSVAPESTRAMASALFAIECV